MDLRNAIQKRAAEVAGSRVQELAEARRQGEIREVAEAIRDGAPLHRDILLQTAREVDPTVAPRERTEVLERIITTYVENGSTYRGRD